MKKSLSKEKKKPNITEFLFFDIKQPFLKPKQEFIIAFILCDFHLKCQIWIKINKFD